MNESLSSAINPPTLLNPLFIFLLSHYLSVLLLTAAFCWLFFLLFWPSLLPLTFSLFPFFCHPPSLFSPLWKVLSKSTFRTKATWRHTLAEGLKLCSLTCSPSLLVSSNHSICLPNTTAHSLLSRSFRFSFSNVFSLRKGGRMCEIVKGSAEPFPFTHITRWQKSCRAQCFWKGCAGNPLELVCEGLVNRREGKRGGRKEEGRREKRKTKDSTNRFFSQVRACIRKTSRERWLALLTVIKGLVTRGSHTTSDCLSKQVYREVQWRKQEVQKDVGKEEVSCVFQ